jgi:hypothetical protein
VNDEPANCNFIGAAEARYFWSVRSTLSQSERIFVDSIPMLGLEEAIYWAKKFNLEYVRPLQILKSIRAPS